MESAVSLVSVGGCRGFCIIVARSTAPRVFGRERNAPPSPVAKMAFEPARGARGAVGDESRKMLCSGAGRRFLVAVEVC